MTDLNSRQFSLMLESIDAFDNKKIDLNVLINRLNGLLRALEGIDEPWQRMFLKQCGVLEEIYANVLDKTFPAIPNQYMSTINKSTKELRGLIAEKI